jgi:hypothetical protein
MSTLKQSIPVANHESLREELTKGIVRFTFVKKGEKELRSATGTTCLTNIPEKFHPKGVRRPAVKTVPFFDINISKWRSVSTSSLVFS